MEARPGNGTTPNALKRLFWFLSETEYGSKEVDEDVVPFDLNALCPECGYIESAAAPVYGIPMWVEYINPDKGTYRCTGGEWHDIPKARARLVKTEAGYELQVERD